MAKGRKNKQAKKAADAASNTAGPASITTDTTAPVETAPTVDVEDKRAPALDIPQQEPSAQQQQQQQQQTSNVPEEEQEHLKELPPSVSSTDEDHHHGLVRHDTSTMIDDQDRGELVRLATQLSRRRSSVATVPTTTGPPMDAIRERPELDPENGQFDISKWLNHFIEELRNEGYAARNTGVSFRNLDVFGSGSAIELQQNVGSVLMAPLRLGEYFSFGKKSHKQILHGFDGVLKSGELLVVLGRPGSGCSTMLKSMCGELHGLMLGDQSQIHYNGIEQKQMKREFRGEAIYNQEVRYKPALPLPMGKPGKRIKNKENRNAANLYTLG